MNVPLKVLIVFRNDSIAFSFFMFAPIMPKEVFLNHKTVMSTEFTGNTGSAKHLCEAQRSASISLAFGTKNRCVRTGKCI